MRHTPTHAAEGMVLTTLQQLEAAGAGLAGGLLSGFFGVGGNVVLVPLLALALGLAQHDAQGLTLAALLPPLGAPAVWEYRRQGVPVPWKVVGLCGAGFLPAVPLGSLAAQALPAQALRLGFALLLVVAARRAWRGRGASAQGAEAALGLPSRWVVIALGAGALSGFASGLLGIGGAIILIPVLTGALRLSQRQAQLASLVMLLPPLALPAVLIYARAQASFPWGALVPVALGFTAGAFGGAWLSHRLSAARLERGFAVLLALSALGLVASALQP